MTNWQPIETAPKAERPQIYGGDILLGSSRTKQVSQGFWFTGDAGDPPHFHWEGGGEPTHWMPLPDPPTDEVAK